MGDTVYHHFLMYIYISFPLLIINMYSKLISSEPFSVLKGGHYKLVADIDALNHFWEDKIPEIKKRKDEIKEIEDSLINIENLIDNA